MKTHLFVILAILVLVLIGSISGAWYILFVPGKVDFDKRGGTILVYELAPDAGNADPEEVRVQQMAQALRNRLDPDNRGLVIVQPAGKNRIEIRIARDGDHHADDVASIVVASRPESEGGSA